MKKLVITAIAASSLSVAAPALAEDTTTSADPFVSTQAGGALGGLGVGGALVAGTFALIAIAAASGTD